MGLLKEKKHYDDVINSPANIKYLQLSTKTRTKKVRIGKNEKGINGTTHFHI